MALAYGHQAYNEANQRLQVDVLPYWFLGLVLVTFLLGLLVELVPFPRSLAPSWSRLALSVVVLGFLIFLITPFGVTVFGADPLGLPTMSTNPWIAATLSLLLGVFVADGLVTGRRGPERS